jgi:hypothetical protein
MASVLVDGVVDRAGDVRRIETASAASPPPIEEKNGRPSSLHVGIFGWRIFLRRGGYARLSLEQDQAKGAEDAATNVIRE